VGLSKRIHNVLHRTTASIAEAPPHSLLAIVSAGLAFYRPTIFSMFAAALLNGMAVWAWWD
jgi:hypothetical protein